MWDNIFPKSSENFKIYDLGLKAYNLGDYKGAVKCFKGVIEKEPDITSGWYMLLESLSYLGNWKELITIGAKASKINPKFGLNYLWLGDAYIQLGKRKKAIDYYKKGLKLLEKELDKYPKNDTILNCIGEFHIKLGNYEDAIKSSKRASNINPKSEHHLHSIGLAYKELGDYDKAIEFYEKSLDVNPEHSYAWFDLGLIYQDLNELDKAIKCYEKAVESTPQWVKLREKLFKIKPDSIALLKKAPDIRILFNKRIEQQHAKSEMVLNDLNEVEKMLKGNKLTDEERKYFEQRKLKLKRELELDAESRQDKLIQLKKLLSESSALIRKIEQKPNEKEKKDLFERLKIISKTVEKKRKEIYNTEKTLKSALIIPFSDLSVKENRLLWELMKMSANDSTEFMELMKQELDFYKEGAERMKDMNEQLDALKNYGKNKTFKLQARRTEEHKKKPLPANNAISTNTVVIDTWRDQLKEALYNYKKKKYVLGKIRTSEQIQDYFLRKKIFVLKGGLGIATWIIVLLPLIILILPLSFYIMNPNYEIFTLLEYLSLMLLIMILLFSISSPLILILRGFLVISSSGVYYRKFIRKNLFSWDEVSKIEGTTKLDYVSLSKEFALVQIFLLSGKKINFASNKYKNREFSKKVYMEMFFNLFTINFKLFT